MAPGFSKACNLLSKHRALSDAPVAFHRGVSGRQEVTGKQPGATEELLHYSETAAKTELQRPLFSPTAPLPTFWHLSCLAAGRAALNVEVYMRVFKTQRFVSRKQRDLGSYGSLTARVLKHTRRWLFRWFRPVNKHLQQRPVKSGSGQTAAPPWRWSKGARRLHRGGAAVGGLPD